MGEASSSPTPTAKTVTASNRRRRRASLSIASTRSISSAPEKRRPSGEASAASLMQNGYVAGIIANALDWARDWRDRESFYLFKKKELVEGKKNGLVGWRKGILVVPNKPGRDRFRVRKSPFPCFCQ